MDIINCALRRDERAIFQLKQLYEQLGYKKYKMSKFEEYDLYQENKSFLPSQRVVTFTDKNGKLMALKPDVTLSIAKNAPARPTEPEKLYYNENVYRCPKGSDDFKEIMQVGLELVGQVDLYGESEVLCLALRSLQTLSDNSVMAVSHMGFVSGMLEYCGFSGSLQQKIVDCIGHKNQHEIRRLCLEGDISQEKTDCVASLAALHGAPEKTIESARQLVKNDAMAQALGRLEELFAVLDGESDGKIMLDFSVINDLSYYNGLIFQGFVGGIPNALLSGGRYDRLMERLGKKAGAIGFAVYVDQLERFGEDEDEYDADVLLLYDPGADVSKLCAAVRMLTANGQRVRVQSAGSDTLRVRQLLKLGEGGLEILEANA